MSEKRIVEFINEKPLFVSPYTPLKVVWDMMKGSHTSHLPVTNSSHKALGIVCKKTLNSFCLSSHFSNLMTEQIMDNNFLTFNDKDSLKFVVEKMVSSDELCFVIIDDSQKIVGIFTLIEALKTLNSYLKAS